MKKRRVIYVDEAGNNADAFLYDNEPLTDMGMDGHYHIEVIPESYYLCIENKEYKSSDLCVLENLLKEFMKSEGAEIPANMGVPWRTISARRNTGTPQQC